jgi:hypothetical protein
VELEQRYCFLFTSVNPNELSLLSIGKGKTKKPSPAKARLSYCQNRTPKIVWVTGIIQKKWRLYNLSLAQNLKVISLHYMQITWDLFHPLLSILSSSVVVCLES